VEAEMTLLTQALLKQEV